MKSKKALSTIVTSIIIIALVLVTGTIIFGVVQNVVKNNLTKSEACFNLYEKIEFNEDYTCFNSSGGYMQFSIDRKEIALDSLRVAISLGNSSKIFLLTDLERDIPELTNYPSNNTGVKLPGNSSGLTYIANGISGTPTLIEMAPVRGKINCEVIDKISTILNCI